MRMVGLGFAAEDLWSRRWAVAFLMIQIFVMSFLLFYSLEVIRDGRDAAEKLKAMECNQVIYKLSDTLEGEELGEALKKIREPMKEMSDYLNEQDEVQLITLDNSMDFVFDSEDETAAGLGEDVLLPSEVRMAKYLLVNNDFFSFFSIEGDYSFEEKDGIDAVYLGHAFRKYYAVGDVIQDGYGDRYYVKGFLPAGAVFMNPFQNKDLEHLDEYVVGELQIDSDSAAEDYWTYLNDTFLVAASDKAFTEIESVRKQSGLDAFRLESFTRQVQESIMTISSAIISTLFFAAIALIFVSVGLVTALLIYIEECYQEFAINLLCGARHRDILFRIIGQLILMIEVPLLAAYLILKPEEVAVQGAVLAICYLCLISTVPVYHFRATSLIQAIWSE